MQEAERGVAPLPGPILSTEEGLGLSQSSSSVDPPSRRMCIPGCPKRDYGTSLGLLRMGLTGEEIL